MNSHSNPWELFEPWIADAHKNPFFNPDTVALATVSLNHQPSLRMVYYRGLREGGLSFFTNFDSKKGGQMLENPKAAMLFYWPHLKRQIRVEGTITKLSPEISDNYFSDRPRESQITASVSKQSRPLQSYEKFENELKDFTHQNEGKELIRPQNWGGYKLLPELFEFWISQKHRRHKRQIFRKQETHWLSELIYP